MKILKFEEYINERLFKSSIDRIESDKIRKEDLIDIDIFNWDTDGLVFFNLLVNGDYYRSDGFHEFIEKYVDFKEQKEFIKNTCNFYKSTILNYVHFNDSIGLGFKKTDKSVMPDYEYTFNLKDKKIKINITYNKNDGCKVFCVQNEKQDISDTSYGKILINSFYNVIHNVLDDNLDDDEKEELIKKNIKNNFSLFYRILNNILKKHKEVDDGTYYLTYYDKGIEEMNDNEYLLYKFLFEYIEDGYGEYGNVFMLNFIEYEYYVSKKDKKLYDMIKEYFD